MRDWRDPDAYAFTGGLTAAQWAWEFLRRNPDYRREWAVFVAVWRELEAAYGAPPHRDFPAWRQDPRAWVHASDCPEGECRVDQHRVLIECALGARWGFHKFPPDPADDDPVGAGRLVWREPSASEPIEVVPQDRAWLGTDPARIALGFDLALPLREQIERAKRHLQMIQRQRVRAGLVRLATVANLGIHWTGLLRLLDAEAAGVDPTRLPAELAGRDPERARAEAHRLRDRGYRWIAALPER
ncbi:MAG: DUF6499 domain-containing protein [Gammaproteobacteria bacterium]|jgi:hypothetical protein|nr:DUF6499 domain-containing protein [Chromatiaceae bacterium]MCU0935519.1 DUF6499 domain-containing protein [Gammaproteobacteria bacterium]